MDYEVTRLEDELAQAKKRIAELAAMLNNAVKDRAFEVENERDACARALTPLLETDDPSAKRAYQHAIDAINARKDPAVRWIQEMAVGTVLGEFVQRMVDEAVARERQEAVAVVLG